jgi:ribonuclease HII
MIEDALIAAGITTIAGVDEAGRGACAGPLVVAAVILQNHHHHELSGVRDSKELNPNEREVLFDVIIRHSIKYAIIEISPQEIDEIGLHRSNLEGMRRAISALGIEPQYILTDGYEIEGLNAPSLAVWKGDQVALTISAASILAKVYRDRLMTNLETQFPGYGFATHKGYVTRAHEKALTDLGVSPIHRRSYANIAALLNS